MIYHIFTNNYDEYTKDKQEAYAIYDRFILEHGTARLYEKVTEDEDGDCIEAHGPYPA